MRIMIQYVIPAVALALIVLLLIRNRASGPSDDESVISTPLIIGLLALGGVVAVGLIFLTLDLLGIV